MKPYYQDDWVTIYHCDCREILPGLPIHDLLLTDPPYGIGRDKGMGGGGGGLTGRRSPRRYSGDWDSVRPSSEALAVALSSARVHIVWGGNYFAGTLPQASKWLVWDKEQTMPGYSDAELAWTTLPGVAVKMFRYSGNGLVAKDKDRWHPTQKPLSLILWCMGLANFQTVIDPFMGSGTTLRAAKDLNRKAIGIEIDERYCEIAAKRMGQEVFNFG